MSKYDTRTDYVTYVKGGYIDHYGTFHELDGGQVTQEFRSCSNCYYGRKSPIGVCANCYNARTGGRIKFKLAVDGRYF